MQNPRNTTRGLNVNGPAAPMGKSNVASGSVPAFTGQKSTQPSVSALPSAKAGATPKKGNGVAAPQGVQLGTTHGQHHVAHRFSPTSAVTKSIQQGK